MVGTDGVRVWGYDKMQNRFWSRFRDYVWGQDTVGTGLGAREGSDLKQK